MEFFKTGNKEFNEIFGGLPIPSGVIVEGHPGAGKTTFSNSLLNVKGTKKLVVLTNNTPKEAKQTMKDSKINSEDINFLDFYSWLAGEKADIESLGNLTQMLIKIEDNIVKDSVVLFDSLTPLDFYNSHESIQRFFQQLMAIVKSKNSILLVTLDSNTYSGDVEETLESLADVVIELDQEQGIRFKKSVSANGRAFHYYTIDKKGFKIRDIKTRSKGK